MSTYAKKNAKKKAKKDCLASLKDAATYNIEVLRNTYLDCVSVKRVLCDEAEGHVGPMSSSLLRKQRSPLKGP